MKRLAWAFALTLAFSARAVLSAQVHDWHDLDDVHKHVIESISPALAGHADAISPGVCLSGVRSHDRSRSPNGLPSRFASDFK